MPTSKSSASCSAQSSSPQRRMQAVTRITSARPSSHFLSKTQSVRSSFALLKCFMSSPELLAAFTASSRFFQGLGPTAFTAGNSKSNSSTLFTALQAAADPKAAKAACAACRQPCRQLCRLCQWLCQWLRTRLRHRGGASGKQPTAGRNSMTRTSVLHLQRI